MPHDDLGVAPDVWADEDFGPVAPDMFRGPDFWGTETVATRLADAAAEAHDAYALISDECGEAEAAFNDKWHEAYEESEEKSEAAKKGEADHAACVEKSTLVKAQKREKRAGKHIDVLLARMTVAMAHQKHMGRQDGGNW